MTAIHARGIPRISSNPRGTGSAERPEPVPMRPINGLMVGAVAGAGGGIVARLAGSSARQSLAMAGVMGLLSVGGWAILSAFQGRQGAGNIQAPGPLPHTRSGGAQGVPV